MKQSTFNVLISIVICCLGVILYPRQHITYNYEVVFKRDTVYIDRFNILNNPKEDLYRVLQHYNIQYPHIVYAQAILETGNFTSKNCLVNNNLFGLYDSKNKKYFKFNHWTESVKAYKNMIQYRFTINSDKPPNDDYYYQFLHRIGYAEDKYYISKVKNIVDKNTNKE